MSSLFILVVFLINDTPLLSQAKRTIQIDGVINPEEYPGKVDLIQGRATLYYGFDSSNVYFGLIYDVPGWFAIGFNPEEGMKNADMIIILEHNGRWILQDAYSTGIYGPHREDTKLGGTSDILDYKISVYEGYKVVELKRKMSTGDKYDAEILPGKKIKLIFAGSKHSKISRKHDLVKGTLRLVFER